MSLTSPSSTCPFCGLSEEPKDTDGKYVERVFVVISGNWCPYRDTDHEWTPKDPVLPCKHPARTDDCCSLDGMSINKKCPLPKATKRQFDEWDNTVLKKQGKWGRL